MLLISRSMDLWKILPYVGFINCRFHLFLSSASSLAPYMCSQIIKELCSSSSYSFHFRHLSFNVIIKKAILYQNMTNPFVFSTQDIIQKCPLLTFLLVTFSDHFIFSILFQHHISKLSKYFHSSFFFNLQVSEPYNSMLQNNTKSISS